jgi:hypothetical protein
MVDDMTRMEMASMLHRDRGKTNVVESVSYVDGGALFLAPPSDCRAEVELLSALLHGKAVSKTKVGQCPN